MENGDGDHYREQMLRAHSVPYSEIREKKCNFEKIHCLRFKNLKLVFFDQNMNRLELEGHGRDELRNNFEKWLMLYIIHTIFSFLGYCAMAREKMIILCFKK